jgi:hypothetical protein
MRQVIITLLIRTFIVGPIRILDSKANGITFDPFGKFMATQSSEERTVTIWRI